MSMLSNPNQQDQAKMVQQKQALLARRCQEGDKGACQTLQFGQQGTALTGMNRSWAGEADERRGVRQAAYNHPAHKQITALLNKDPFWQKKYGGFEDDIKWLGENKDAVGEYEKWYGKHLTATGSGNPNAYAKAHTVAMKKTRGYVDGGEVMDE